jgi:hypothetical protein
MLASKERLGKHVPTTMDTRMNVLSPGAVSKSYKERQLGQTSQFCTGVCEEKRQLERSRHSEKT